MVPRKNRQFIRLFLLLSAVLIVLLGAFTTYVWTHRSPADHSDDEPAAQQKQDKTALYSAITHNLQTPFVTRTLQTSGKNLSTYRVRTASDLSAPATAQSDIRATFFNSKTHKKTDSWRLAMTDPSHIAYHSTFNHPRSAWAFMDRGPAFVWEYSTPSEFANKHSSASAELAAAGAQHIFVTGKFTPTAQKKIMQAYTAAPKPYLLEASKTKHYTTRGRDIVRYTVKLDEKSLQAVNDLAATELGTTSIYRAIALDHVST